MFAGLGFFLISLIVVYPRVRRIPPPPGGSSADPGAAPRAAPSLGLEAEGLARRGGSQGRRGEGCRESGASAPHQMAETLFVKVERVRRLHSARLVDVDVHRGEDGSFGIGLSDDNVVTNFHHSTNTASLQLGDQVCKVDGVTLVRERLAHLVQRQFADVQQVCKTGLGSGSGLADATLT